MKRSVSMNLVVMLTAVLIIVAGYHKKAEAEVDLETQKKIDKLTQQIKSNNYDVTIIMALGETRDKRAVEPLLEVIRDKNKKHRATAVKALAMIEDVIKDERVIPTLINLLIDKDEEIWVRRYTIGVLGYLKDKRAIPELKKCLKDTDPKIRSYTIGALASIEDKASLPDLIGMLQDDNIEVRRTAVRILGNLRDKKALPSLEKVATSDENIQVRKEAKHAIMKIKKPRKEIKIDPKLKAKIDDIIKKLNAMYIRELKPGEFETLQKEMKEIAQKESATVPYLIERMEKTCESTSSMEAAGWGIMTEAGILVEVIGEPAFPELMKVVEDEARDPKLRALVSELVGGMRGTKDIGPFIKILRNKKADDYVRAEAASTLGDIGDKRAVEPLLEALEDKNEQVRSIAALSLGRLGDKRATEPLLVKLNDPSHTMRIRIIMALGALRDSRAVEPLIKLLDDEDESIASKAARSLGALKDPRAVEPLLSILRTKTDFRQIGVIEALSQIGDKRAVEPLIAILQGKNEYLMIYAGPALAQIGNQRAVKPLENAIKRVKDTFVKKKLKEAYKALTGEEYQEKE